MTTGRALTTETQREYLAGEEGEQRMYEARSRIRARINGPLKDDIELFAEHAPGLLEELREVVCEDVEIDEMNSGRETDESKTTEN